MKASGESPSTTLLVFLYIYKLATMNPHKSPPIFYSDIYEAFKYAMHLFPSSKYFWLTLDERASRVIPSCGLHDSLPTIRLLFSQEGMVHAHINLLEQCLTHEQMVLVGQPWISKQGGSDYMLAGLLQDCLLGISPTEILSKDNRTSMKYRRYNKMAV